MAACLAGSGATVLGDRCRQRRSLSNKAPQRFTKRNPGHVLQRCCARAGQREPQSQDRGGARGKAEHPPCARPSSGGSPFAPHLLLRARQEGF